jgi:hypothetical protein
VRRHVVALALIAGVIAPAVSVASALAAPSDKPAVSGVGIRLVDVPKATGDDPRARSYIIDHLSSGDTIKRRVEVTNAGDSATKVTVYAAAASLVKGAFVGGDGHARNDLTDWTSTTPEAAVLKAGQKTFVEVAIKVPPNTEPGERYGVVWVEKRTPPGKGVSVTQVGRVGIRLYLSIGTGTAPKSDFEIVSMAPARDQDKVPMINAAVRNTGERALDLNGELRLSDGPGGLSGGPFPVTLGTSLGIGETTPVLVKLDSKLPDGPWKATLTIKSGLTTRTAEAVITFPSGPGEAPAVAAQEPAELTWWMIGLGVVAVLGLSFGVAGVLLWRSRRPTISARRSQV